MTRIVFTTAALLISETLLASYPTVWTWQNHTNKDVEVYCAATPAGLPGVVLEVRQGVAAQEAVSHAWEGIHNDGLGLNAADWDCSLSGETTSGAVILSTKWGEDQNLIIVVQDGQLTYERQ